MNIQAVYGTSNISSGIQDVFYQCMSNMLLFGFKYNVFSLCYLLML